MSLVMRMTEKDIKFRGRGQSCDCRLNIQARGCHDRMEFPCCGLCLTNRFLLQRLRQCTFLSFHFDVKKILFMIFFSRV